MTVMLCLVFADLISLCLGQCGALGLGQCGAMGLNDENTPLPDVRLSAYSTYSEADALLSVIVALEVKHVKAVLDDSIEAVTTVTTLLPKLDQKEIMSSLVTAQQDVALNVSAPDAVDTVLLVLGSYGFVESFFVNTLIYNSQREVFNGLWLTTVDVRHLDDLRQVITWPCQHVAVISRDLTGHLSLLTLRHVGDDSELICVTSLPPPSATPLTRHQVLPNRRYGLKGRNLRVTVKEYGTYLSSNNDTNTTVYQGVVMNLLEELAFRLNFSYTIVPAPANESYGQQLDNGQWDGPVGMLVRQDVDMAFSFFTITYDRARAVETVRYASESAVVIFRPAPSSSGSGWTFFLKPFRTPVYLLVGASLLCVMLLLLLLEKGQGCLRGTDCPTVAHSVSTNLENLFAGLLNKPANEYSASDAGRVVMMTWLILGVVLTSSYSSQLTSTLMSVQATLPFSSLGELMQQDTWTWGVASGSGDETMLKASTEKELLLFYTKILEFAKTDPDVLSNDFDHTHQQKVLNGSYAWFAFASVYESWTLRYCEISYLPVAFSSVPVGFFLQKGSPYYDLMNEQTLRMVDSGLIEHWIHESSPRKPGQCETDEDLNGGGGGRAIGLTETQTAFLLAAMGMGLSLFVLALEVLRARKCSGH